MTRSGECIRISNSVPQSGISPMAETRNVECRNEGFIFRNSLFVIRYSEDFQPLMVFGNLATHSIKEKFLHVCGDGAGLPIADHVMIYLTYRSDFGGCACKKDLVGHVK